MHSIIRQEVDVSAHSRVRAVPLTVAALLVALASHP